MTPETKAPTMMTVPTQSISPMRVLYGVPVRGSWDGRRKIQTGAKTAPIMRLEGNVRFAWRDGWDEPSFT